MKCKAKKAFFAGKNDIYAAGMQSHWFLPRLRQ